MTMTPEIPWRLAAGVLLASVTTLAVAAKPAIPLNAAAAAFKEKQTLCRRDSGRLWGRSLCGPTMFVDVGSHEAVLNEAVPGAVKDGPLYRITLPKTMGLGNTAIDYHGKRWTMVIWPLPDDRDKRRVLLMHESYHRIQPALGLTGSGGLGKNSHLDTQAGRTWLRGELHALRVALTAHGQARRKAVADALLFRQYRRSLWPRAAAEEDGLELNEGLAEYTGIDAALATPRARVAAAAADIDRIEKTPSYVRSFAYATGPAYGELLDVAAPGWRRGVDAHFDFGKAAARAFGIEMPDANAKLARQLLKRYGGDKIVAQETARAKIVAARNRRYKSEFVTGPTLTLPLSDRKQISFDPRAVRSFAGHGSVYGTLTVNDDWGTLEVESGDVLINSGFNAVIVPITAPPDGSSLAGHGWTATLKPGFRPTPEKSKKGSYIVHATGTGG